MGERLEIIITANTAGLSSGLSGGQSMLGKFGSTLGAIFTTSGGFLFAQGIMSLGGQVKNLGGAFLGMIDMAADAEAQLDSIRAVSGATAEETGQLKELINQLGINPNLKVSATEAADAIEMLAKNGVAVTDILNGAAEATVLMANSTGGTFSQSADIATDAMAQFKIEADDMMSVVAGVTGVVQNSKFTIDDYALAIAQGGAVANAMGVEFEDFNATIAITSSQFASGSDAGTSYKTFLQRLVPQSKEAQKAMKELGLDFFDANGQLKDQAQIAEELNRVLNKEFTVTNQVGGATDKMIKAADSARGKIGPLNNTIEEQNDQLFLLHRELAVTIEKYGEGSIQADKKRLAINKLNNSLNENEDKYNALQAQIDAVDNAQVSTISSTKRLSEEEKNKYLTTIFGADAMRTAVGLADAGAVKYTDMAQAAKELGVEQSALNDYVEGGITNYEAMLIQMSKTDPLAAAKMRMDNLKGSMEIFGGIVESIQIQIGDKFLGIAKSIVDGASSLLEGNSEAIIGFFSGIADKATMLLNVIKGLWEGDPFALEVAGQEFGDFGMLVSRTVDNVKEMIDKFKSGDIMGGFSEIGDILSDTWSTMIWPKLQEWGTKFWDWLTGDEGATGQAEPKLNGFIDTLNALLGESWPKIAATLQTWSDKFFGWLLGDEGQPGAIAKVGESMGQLVSEIQTWANSDEGQGKLRTLGQNLGNFLITGVELAVNNSEKIESVMLALGESMAAAVPAMLDALDAVAGAVVNGLFEKMAEKMGANEGFAAFMGASGQSAASFIPGLAGGTSNFSGGMAIVGERGPELVSLPRGSSVTPNSQLAGDGMGGGITINVSGAGDPMAVAAAVKQELQNIFGGTRR